MTSLKLRTPAAARCQQQAVWPVRVVGSWGFALIRSPGRACTGPGQFWVVSAAFADARGLT